MDGWTNFNHRPLRLDSRIGLMMAKNWNVSSQNFGESSFYEVRRQNTISGCVRDWDVNKKMWKYQTFYMFIYYFCKTHWTNVKLGQERLRIMSQNPNNNWRGMCKRLHICVTVVVGSEERTLCQLMCELRCIQVRIYFWANHQLEWHLTKTRKDYTTQRRLCPNHTRSSGLSVMGFFLLLLNLLIS